MNYHIDVVALLKHCQYVYHYGTTGNKVAGLSFVQQLLYWFYSACSGIPFSMILFIVIVGLRTVISNCYRFQYLKGK